MSAILFNALFQSLLYRPGRMTGSWSVCTDGEEKREREREREEGVSGRLPDSTTRSVKEEKSPPGEENCKQEGHGR